MALAVVEHHALDAELLEALRRGGNADEAAAELGHEVDRLGRGLLGGHDQVALVFAIGVVDDDDHFAARDVAQHRLDGVKFARDFLCCHVTRPLGRLPALGQAVENRGPFGFRNRLVLT